MRKPQVDPQSQEIEKHILKVLEILHQPKSRPEELPRVAVEPKQPQVVVQSALKGKVVDLEVIRTRLATYQGKSSMTRDELSLNICLKLPDLRLSAREGRLIVDTLTELIQEALKAGRKVALQGFGTFHAKHCAARVVRNPRVAAGPNAFKKVGPRTKYQWKPGSGFAAPLIWRKGASR
jgi:nucleoid DNA-binding protein